MTTVIATGEAPRQSPSVRLTRSDRGTRHAPSESHPSRIATECRGGWASRTVSQIVSEMVRIRRAYDSLMRIHPFIAGLTIALLSSAPAVGQPATPPEISGGYFALTAGSDGYPKGYFLDLVANVTSRFGFVFGTDGAYRSESFEYLVLGGRRVQGEGTVILETLPVTIKTTTRGMVAGG